MYTNRKVEELHVIGQPRIDIVKNLFELQYHWPALKKSGKKENYHECVRDRIGWNCYGIVTVRKKVNCWSENCVDDNSKFIQKEMIYLFS